MMLWIHHQKAVAAPDADSTATGRKVLNRISGLEDIDRLVVEGHIGSDAVPSVPRGRRAGYYRARFDGHPMLVMTTGRATGPDETVDTWFSAAALGAWRHRVEGDTSVPLPRRRARVYRTGDEATPFVILGARIRRWSASQDLPKPLVGATADDPDGSAFLGDLGGRRWKPIVQPLVAEMVKEALRPVPEATPMVRYQIATLGDGQMIRYGRTGPVWIDAEAAVHLADLAGYALGQPSEISHPLGGDGWSLLSEILPDEADTATAVATEIVRTETVSYAVAAGKLGAAELKRVFPEYRWGRGGRHGERLRDDAGATYVRSLYHGHPAFGITVGDRREWWMSSSAQAEMIDMLHRESTPQQQTVVTEPEEASAGTPPLRLRKRQRRAISRLARAIARLADEGMPLVIEDGEIKVRVEDGRRKSRGLVTVFAPASASPNADQ